MPKSLNIILFGETGVGKSSLVNLIAGKHVAETSPDGDVHTLEYKAYDFQPHSGVSYTIWDTRGFTEADTDMGAQGYLHAVKQAYQLIRELSKTGGVDLLVLCHREGRITTTTRNNYRLFYEVFCDAKVPIAIVITHLERHARMDEWWEQNVEVFERNQMNAVAHACVTALSGHAKSLESRQAIERMLGQHDDKGRYNMPSVEWFRRFSGRWAKVQGFPRGLKKDNLEAFLRERCGLGIRDAHDVACILAGQDNKGPKKRFFGLLSF